MDSNALWPVLAGIVRHMLTTLGGMLITAGYMQSSDMAGFVGGGMIVAGIIWSWWQKVGQKKALELLSRARPAAKVVIVALAVVMLLAAAPAYAGKITLPGQSTTAATKLTASQASTNPLALLGQFTVTDLNNAIADAQAQTPPDTAAVTCYSALLSIVQSKVANPLPASPGIFQALQKARDAKAALANLQSPTGPLAGLNTACAPLIVDAQTTLVGLGVAVGLVNNPVGAGAALTGLPAAVATFLALPKL